MPAYGCIFQTIPKRERKQMKKKLQGVLILTICMTFTGIAFALTNIELLGKAIYEDPTYSANGNQSCQSCHHPKAQFSDPVNRISPMYRPVSEGSHAGLFGGRNAPPAAYAAFSPPMFFDGELFIGGLFWDGSASGLTFNTATGGLGDGPTGDPLADQAKGPFQNPVEMALPSDGFSGTVEEEVLGILQAAHYAKLYKKAFGTDIMAADPYIAYNNIALAISAFEQSTELNTFSSRFDEFCNEQGIATVLSIMDNSVAPTQYVLPPIKSTVYTQEAMEGLALFNGKAMCSACHILDDQPDGKTATVFTDFSFDNLGIPVNPAVAELAGPQKIDYGLGARTAELLEAYGENVPALETIPLPDGLGNGETIEVVDGEEGKFKVSSLRNIAKTAPYGHNGFFPTLYDIVHFYNTRDLNTDGTPFVDPDGNPIGGVKEPLWPQPEVPATVNHAELGNLGLTFEEEQKIVVFLETLTDEVKK